MIFWWLIGILLCATAQIDGASSYSITNQCNNGQIIAADEFCDGNLNCLDGSDETLERCQHRECPSFAFRCAYGACVSGNALCNNKKDCSDNSDEISIKCQGDASERANATTQIVTASTNFTTNQCNNGQIIFDDELCDGNLDCIDGSDETLERCQYNECPSHAFRCAYGACVPRNALCNNKKDCSDNSDETSIRCQRNLQSHETNVVTKINAASPNFTQKCNNGQIVATDKFCDGKVHCRDGSDETVEKCLHTRCPAFAFQCAYGACVNGNAECDHEQDCNDNSDETTIRCEGVLERYRISGNCSENHFQCSSGECIPEHNACDGKKHCRDYSDETVELCVAFYCPSFAFRCGYGACVRGDAECDGVIDCLDGSDEICGKPTTNKETTTTTTESTPIVVTENITKRPLATSTESSVKPRKACNIDSIPHMKFFLQVFRGEEVLAGTVVSEYTNIKYGCEGKYVLTGVSTNMCFKGSWINPLPKCISNVGTFDEQGQSFDSKNTTGYCSYIPLFGVTFSAKCKYNEQEIPCNQSLKSGTEAELSCKPGYQKPNRRVYNNIICDDHGDWDYSPYRCEAICGIDPSDGTSEKTVQPWYAGIYRLYDPICGGTIISSRIVLSAAHCFWDERKQRQINAEIFEVAVGKQLRSYDAWEPNPVYFFMISEVYISPEYKGRDLYHQFDIAILVLNNYIVFTDKIAPICIEWLSITERQKELSGTVSGWGNLRNRSDRQSKLRTLQLNKVDYQRCAEKTPPAYRNLITYDKFCVDNEDGEPLCDGDSGSGFITSKIINGRKTHFLDGVISNGLHNQTTCEGSFCTTCTDIQDYANIINEYLLKYQPK